MLWQVGKSNKLDFKNSAVINFSFVSALFKTLQKLRIKFQLNTKILRVINQSTGFKSGIKIFFLQIFNTKKSTEQQTKSKITILV